jgi:hypothetical protein
VIGSPEGIKTASQSRSNIMVSFLWYMIVDSSPPHPFPSHLHVLGFMDGGIGVIGVGEI